jgi:hypothetical protein
VKGTPLREALRIGMALIDPAVLDSRTDPPETLLEPPHTTRPADALAATPTGTGTGTGTGTDTGTSTGACAGICSSDVTASSTSSGSSVGGGDGGDSLSKTESTATCTQGGSETVATPPAETLVLPHPWKLCARRATGQQYWIHPETNERRYLSADNLVATTLLTLGD